jgi:hypothetical protein
MRIPKTVLDATASRAWRTSATPRMPGAQPLADVNEPQEPRASEPPPPQPVRVVAPMPPGDVLHAALLAVAGDDAASTLLLASASVEERDQLVAKLAYLEMSSLAGRNPALAALVASLDAAPDDEARTALLADAPRELATELAAYWWRPARDVDVAQRYMDMLPLPTA